MKNIIYQEYCPTEKELNKIKEELKFDKIATTIASIVFSSMVLYSIFAFLKNETFSIIFSAIVFILLSLFVGLAIWLAKDAYKKCNLNLNEVQFTSGFILNTWSESSGGERKSRNYYAKIELSNNNILERVQINSTLYGYANNNVVLAIKDDEILCVILKEI